MDIRHNEAAQRFEMEKDGHIAMLEYRLSGDVITYYHTEVPAMLEGQGIGSKLAKAALDFARDKSYRVLPTCWFVAGYIKRHPEYQGLLK